MFAMFSANTMLLRHNDKILEVVYILLQSVGSVGLICYFFDFIIPTTCRMGMFICNINNVAILSTLIK